MQPSTDYGRPVHEKPLALYPRDIPEWRPKKADFVPTLTPMFPANHDPAQKRGMVIVAPGGGYHVRAEHERTPFVRLFNNAGLVSAILDYRTVGECEPPLRKGPLADAQRAIRLVRAHAGAWGVDPERIGMLGFSAGGHLTACAGVHWDAGDPDGYDAAEKASCRPDHLMLGYAVINGDRVDGHKGSFHSLLGDDPSAADEDFFSTDRHVNAQTPPAFFFHTAADRGVPVIGAMAFAGKLYRHDIRFAMHVFPEGPHGLGLASERPDASAWGGLMVNWLLSLGY